MRAAMRAGTPFFSSGTVSKNEDDCRKSPDPVFSQRRALLQSSSLTDGHIVAIRARAHEDLSRMALSATACAAFVRSMRGGFALAPSSLARAALAVVCGALPLALLPAARRAARRLSSARARDVVALHECESCLLYTSPSPRD